MLLAAKMAFMAGGRPTAKSYIQDGLVAMWDGIENVGRGRHDANATEWVDLVGGQWGSWNIQGAGVDYAIFSNSNQLKTFGTAVAIPSTIELSFDSIATSASGAFLNLRAGNNTQSGMLCPYIWRTGARLEFYSANRYVTFGQYYFGSTFSVNYTSSNITAYRNGGEYVKTISGLTNQTAYTNYSIGRYGSNDKFSGTVRFVRFYSRVLTAKELAHNYAIDKARFNLPDES